MQWMNDGERRKGKGKGTGHKSRSRPGAASGRGRLPVRPDTAGQRLARTHACLTPATEHACDTSPWTLATCDPIFCFVSPSRRPRSRRDRESEKGRPARISACMDHLQLQASPARSRSRSIAPKPSRASRKACIAACGSAAGVIRTPSIRCLCSRLGDAAVCSRLAVQPRRKRTTGSPPHGPRPTPGPVSVPCVRPSLRGKPGGGGAGRRAFLFRSQHVLAAYSFRTRAAARVVTTHHTSAHARCERRALGRSFTASAALQSCRHTDTDTARQGRTCARRAGMGGLGTVCGGAAMLQGYAKKGPASIWSVHA